MQALSRHSFVIPTERQSQKATPPKVLHCVERMHTNAIESWLVRMHRHMVTAGQAVDWHFHVQFAQPGLLETLYPECRPFIIRSPCELSDWRRFFAAFWRVCHSHKFDVVHIHADLMSAPYLIMARLAGVPRTIVHVHNADEHIPVGRALRQRVLREPLRRVCLAMADKIVGNSAHTLDTFLAGRSLRPGCDVVHYYGVDPTPFENATIDRIALRRELGLPEDALILLFAGRITPEKNPVFAVDVLAELRRLEPRAVAVFAGAGSLEEAVLTRTQKHGMDDAVRVLGWRSDLPKVMSSSDWFILPHPERPMEGFGLAVVEAQLAGLRMLLSRGIPDDALLPTAVFRRLPLANHPVEWANAAMELLLDGRPARTVALAALRDSPMDMDRALDGLIRLHA